MIFPPGCKWWHSICCWPIKIQRPEISQKHQLLLESKGSESINMPQQISHFLRHIYLKDTYLSAEIRLHVFQKKAVDETNGFSSNPQLLTTRPLRQKSFLGVFFSKQFQEAENVERTMEVPIGLRLIKLRYKVWSLLGYPTCSTLGEGTPSCKPPW